MKSISIVGNGPVSQSSAELIDAVDLVVRFNRARSCGAAGRRVDILVINRARVYMTKRINPLALHRASEVWVNDIEGNGKVDWLFDQECRARYLGFVPLEKTGRLLAEYGAKPGSKPTTGACIIAELLEMYPEARISLFGFTHEGMDNVHDLNAERNWVDALVAAGRAEKYEGNGPLARRSATEEIAFYARLAEKRLKHYFYNKVLHSGGETKRRIFGK